VLATDSMSRDVAVRCLRK